MTRIFCLLGALLCLAGCAARPAQVLGVASSPAGITAIRDLKAGAGPVALRGTMVEKCPVAGCWFRLRDKTGVIKVDTKMAGFVVSDVPLNTTVTVQGTLKTGPDRQVAATGLSY